MLRLLLRPSPRRRLSRARRRRRRRQRAAAAVPCPRRPRCPGSARPTRTTWTGKRCGSTITPAMGASVGGVGEKGSGCVWACMGVDNSFKGLATHRPHTPRYTSEHACREIREYQSDIVRKALFQNTLVCLPTGLGAFSRISICLFRIVHAAPLATPMLTRMDAGRADRSASPSSNRQDLCGGRGDVQLPPLVPPGQNHLHGPDQAARHPAGRELLPGEYARAPSMHISSASCSLSCSYMPRIVPTAALPFLNTQCKTPRLWASRRRSRR